MEKLLRTAGEENICIQVMSYAEVTAYTQKMESVAIWKLNLLLLGSVWLSKFGSGKWHFIYIILAWLLSHILLIVYWWNKNILKMYIHAAMATLLWITTYDFKWGMCPQPRCAQAYILCIRIWRLMNRYRFLTKQNSVTGKKSPFKMMSAGQEQCCTPHQPCCPLQIVVKPTLK